MKKRNSKGFTLVEIMIVVAIIGLLVAIALPNFLKARQKSVINSAKASMKQIEGAIENYKIDLRTNTCQMTDLVPNYLKTEPVCPQGEWLIDFVNGDVSCVIDSVIYTAYSTP